MNSGGKGEPKPGRDAGPAHRGVGVNSTYRRAILLALESLHDHHSRSNVDAIRRHTQDLLEDQTWNECLFLHTLKAIVRKGEVDLFAKSNVELSPQFKRQRADSLLHRLEECLESNAVPRLPPTSPLSPDSPSHVTYPLKPALHRRSEHDKWKIVPKKEYDRSTIVNPMDIH